MWVRRGMSAAVLAGSLVVASAGLAFSDPSSSDNNLGLGNGTILDLPIQSSVSACGNAVAFIGVSGASCPGGATAIQSGTGGTGSTSNNYGAGNGTQLSAPVQAPITVCGNAVAVIGKAQASCQGTATATNSGGGSGTGNTSGNYGALNGSQASAPIQLPISLCGNAVGNAQASCEGGSTATNSGGGSRSEEHTSELQSHHDLVCRLLLEKKKKNKIKLYNQIKKTNK